MFKKIVGSIAVASLLLIVSCKKEGESTGTDRIEESSAKTSPEIAPKIVDPNAKYATMDFDKTVHDFGSIMQGDKVETSFTFTNNGEADLVIVSAKGSCGCTVPEYPKVPVKPGEKANMKVSFNSSGKKGHNKKSITIQANTKAGVERLSITADITVDPNKKVEARKPKPYVDKPVNNKQTLK